MLRDDVKGVGRKVSSLSFCSVLSSVRRHVSSNGGARVRSVTIERR